MSQSMTGASGLLTSSAKSSRLLPPAEATRTVCHSRIPSPSKSPNTSRTAGDESAVASFEYRYGSCPGGMNDHNSVRGAGGVKLPVLSQLVWNTPFAELYGAPAEDAGPV